MYKEIEQYPNYEINEFGIIRNKTTGNIKKQSDSVHGYMTVRLGKKKLYVHRLVAEAFIPNPHGYPQVNHKDEDKSNNHVSNLEWCTSKYNINYGNRQHLCDENRAKSVLAYSGGECLMEFSSIKKAAELFSVSPSTISAVLRGKRRTAAGYEWKYKTGGTNKSDRVYP